MIERYTAGAMSFGPDYKLFASCICTGISNQITEKPREYFIEGYGLAVADRNRRPNPIDKSLGIGVWDQITGKQIDFFYDDEAT